MKCVWGVRVTQDVIQEPTSPQLLCAIYIYDDLSPAAPHQRQRGAVGHPKQVRSGQASLGKASAPFVSWTGGSNIQYATTCQSELITINSGQQPPEDMRWWQRACFNTPGEFRRRFRVFVALFTS